MTGEHPHDDRGYDPQIKPLLVELQKAGWTNAAEGDIDTETVIDGFFLSVGDETPPPVKSIAAGLGLLDSEGKLADDYLVTIHDEPGEAGIFVGYSGVPSDHYDMTLYLMAKIGDVADDQVLRALVLRSPVGMDAFRLRTERWTALRESDTDIQ